MDRDERAFWTVVVTLVVLLFAWLFYWIATAPTSGTIVTRSFTPEHDELRMVGKIWQNVHVDDYWSMTIRDPKTGRTWSYSVTHETFDAFREGDHISFD